MPRDDNIMHRTYENGIETFVDVKYFDPVLVNNNGKRLARSCKSIQEEKSGDEFERVTKESISNVQEDEKRPC